MVGPAKQESPDFKPERVNAYGNNGFYAFEIKRSTKINNKDLNALKSFGEDYPEAKLYFLYHGELKLHIDNITCLPFEMALKELPQILAL